MLGFLGIATYPEDAYCATPPRLVVFWITVRFSTDDGVDE